MQSLDNLKVIGLMSGTSLDGLDLAYCHFTKTISGWRFSIECTETCNYPSEWNALLSADYKEDNQTRLKDIDSKYGQFLGKKCVEFIKKNDLTPDLISSHGHTIFHQPDKGLTLQIGSGREIAQETHIQTINDFRTQDVELGGQGAPLVPIGDLLLFAEYQQCLNLGGFANISSKTDFDIAAFDICPVNIVLNDIALSLGQPFDESGHFAKSGRVISELFDQLNKLDYYQASPPKSLGKEWVEKHVHPIIAPYRHNPIDLIATFSEHVAFQIGLNLQNDTKTLVTGGGAYNSWLIHRIQKLAPRAQLVIPESKLIEYKEALIFAFLGVLKLNEINNCLSSVTGARKDHCSGVIWLP